MTVMKPSLEAIKLIVLLGVKSGDWGDKQQYLGEYLVGKSVLLQLLIMNL